MSYVTNILVHVSIIDDAGRARITEPQPWDEHEIGQSLGDLGGPEEGDQEMYPLWGGYKVPEWTLYGAAFNYLDWSGFVEWLESLPFEYPSEVMVIAKGETDDLPSIWVMDQRGSSLHLAPVFGDVPR